MEALETEPRTSGTLSTRSAPERHFRLMMGFNANKFIDGASDTMLQITFKKQPPVKF